MQPAAVPATPEMIETLRREAKSIEDWERIICLQCQMILRQVDEIKAALEAA